jgi:hypothetical protein
MLRTIEAMRMSFVGRVTCSWPSAAPLPPVPSAPTESSTTSGWTRSCTGSCVVTPPG